MKTRVIYRNGVYWPQYKDWLGWCGFTKAIPPSWKVTVRFESSTDAEEFCKEKMYQESRKNEVVWESK